MKISRNITLKILFIMDELLPPILRDSKLFMWLPFKIMFGGRSDMFFSFKDKMPAISDQEFSDIYRDTSSVHIDRETDINKECLEQIDISIIGSSVLDIACGRGYLIEKLSKSYNTAGIDIVISEKAKSLCSEACIINASIENIPLSDRSFDTVISAHTLEHVKNPARAVRELRRVAGKRLIIIVPKQRPYKYTFDLHINFFPYKYDLIRMINPKSNHFRCIDCGGDWFYVEDVDGLA